MFYLLFNWPIGLFSRLNRFLPSFLLSLSLYLTLLPSNSIGFASFRCHFGFASVRCHFLWISDWTIYPSEHCLNDRNRVVLVLTRDCCCDSWISWFIATPRQSTASLPRSWIRSLLKSRDEQNMTGCYWYKQNLQADRIFIFYTSISSLDTYF
jgi:hypothetical protein